MHRLTTTLALVAAAGIAAIAMIAALQERSDSSRRAQAELGQIGAQLSERGMAPVGLMFGVPQPVIKWQMAQRQAQIRNTMRGVRADQPIESLDRVDAALDRAFVSHDATMRLMEGMTTRRGRTGIAKAIAGRDPTLTKLLMNVQASSSGVATTLSRADEEYGRRAERARLQATVGTAAAIALLVMAFGLMYRRTLRARVVAEHLAEENASMAEASQKEALTDALTHLGNRRALVADLDAIVSDGDATPLALALFDLDGFKQYNDTFGHQAGDALLRRLGERLVERLDRRARAYRIGGDEFCVLARVDRNDAVTVTRAAADALSESGDAFAVGCSFGLALVPSEASTAEDALRIADQRMYEQKADDRGVSATQQATDVLLQVLSEQSGGLAEHVTGVADLAATIAERLGMDEHEVRHVRIAAQLHDVGKSAVPESILAKPGPLDAEEWEFMRRHTLIGERIVRAAPSLSHVAPLIRSSHERVDGNGYPDGLAGDQIPLGARIIAVCDAFDAMIADRSYRAGVGAAAALYELRRCAGTQFDARVVGEFCEHADRLFGDARAATCA